MDPDGKRLFEEFREFNDGLLRRFDQSMKRIDRRADAQTAQMLEQAVAMREQAAEMREQVAATRDMRDAINANTQGVLWVLDYLRGAEGSA